MLELNINFKKINKIDFNKKVPTKEQMGTIIDESCIIKNDKKTIAVYLILKEKDLKGMRFVAENVKITSSSRTRGLPQKSAVFGPMPRNPAMAQDYCRFSKQMYQQREFLPFIYEYNEFLCDIYKKNFPDIYEESNKKTEQTINKDWRWLGGPYTNCNFNVNQAIPFHTDTANSQGALSNVLILKKGIIGGELVCPEWGVSLSQRDGAFTLFDGQSLMHGVMPIKESKKITNPYRASVVYYNLNGLKNCLCKDEEIVRAKKVVHEKTARTNEERKKNLEKYRGKL